MNSIRNIYRYCKHADHESINGHFPANFGFRDRASRFSILKNYQTAPGPDDCFVHADIDARGIFSKLLGLRIYYPELDEENQAKLTFYNSMNYYPSHIEEVFFHNSLHPLPPVEGKTFMYFLGTDHLRIACELVNHSKAEVSLAFQWFSEPEADTLQEASAAKSGFICVHEQNVIRKYKVKTRLYAHDGDISFTFDGSRFCSGKLERTLSKYGKICFNFGIQFSLNDEKVLSGAALRKRKDDLDEHIKKSEKFYNALPDLPDEFKSHKNIVLKAVSTLRSLRYQYRDDEGRPLLSIQTSKCGVGGSWFWDTAFSLQSFGIMNEPEPAYAAARLLLDGIKEDGTPPGAYSLGGYTYFYQQPVLAWGIGHFLSLCPDNKFLKYAYDRLCRYLVHWLTKWKHEESGLCVHPPGGSCWDDALRWQNRFPLRFNGKRSWTKEDWGNMELDIFISVDTNTYLYLECLTLSRMANVLGIKPEAEKWQYQAFGIARKINTFLFNENQGIYQDRCIKNRAFTEMITPASFIPLYAGITPQKAAQDICRKYLLDPKHFYTEFPFPTLDRSHPAFRSGGTVASPAKFPGSLVQQSYWIGRSWPHVSYWLVGALYNSGLKAEADIAAERILEGMDKNERIYECYDSLTGHGNGHPDYSWSAAAVLALAYMQYKKDPAGMLINKG